MNKNYIIYIYTIYKYIFNNYNKYKYIFFTPKSSSPEVY